MGFPHRSDIEVALLREVERHGCSAFASDLYGPLAEFFKLTLEDLNRTTQEGRSRWENEVRVVRDRLVNLGELEIPATAGRGVWKITPGGRARLGR